LGQTFIICSQVITSQTVEWVSSWTQHCIYRQQSSSNASDEWL